VTDRAPGAAVVRLAGRLDGASAQQADEVLEGLIQDGETRLILDCAGLEFLSSAGIRSLLLAVQHLRSRGGALTLVALRPPVREVLTLTGILPLVGVGETCAEALAAASAPVPAAPAAAAGTGHAPSAAVRAEFAREMQQAVEEVHARHRRLDSGAVATYIPELGKADPAHFGVCVVTADGGVFAAGDCDEPFTIQSISKPLTFGMALEAYGHEQVSRHVGVEPSGDAFNSIELQPGVNRPYNPMINAGAITVSALLHARHGDRAFPLVLERFSQAAGRPLQVDEAVYESERRTGHRNRSIAHLLLNFGMVHEAVEPALEVYFRQCSIMVTCRDLAFIAATVANLGRHPVTGVQVFEPGVVKYMLAIMLTCGMYDYAGEWAYRVGVPAKSGVAGGLMAVVNRQAGLATYSPRLDARGNSVRGIEACVDLAARFGLHAFDPINVGSNLLRALG
jgi:glutaminase